MGLTKKSNEIAYLLLTQVRRSKKPHICSDLESDQRVLDRTRTRARPAISAAKVADSGRWLLVNATLMRHHIVIDPGIASELVSKDGPANKTTRKKLKTIYQKPHLRQRIGRELRLN